MNKRQLKESIKFLEEEWKELKGIIFIGMRKDGLMQSTQKGLNFVETIGLADWFKLSVQDDIRERSYRQQEEERPQRAVI